MKKSIIVAADKNGCIGKDGKLPWHFPEDLKWFKQNTMNHAIVMGRKTYESIGKTLPGRLNIVISSWANSDDLDLSETSLLFTSSVLKAVFAADQINKFQKTSRDCFIIGGAQTYKTAIHLVDEIILTKIPGEYEGDTFFPTWPLEENGWEVKSRVEFPTKEQLEFWIYKRVEK